MALIFQIKGWDQVRKRLEELGPKRVLPKLRIAVDISARIFVGRLRSEYLSGPTSGTTVSSRSGKLRQSIRALPAAVEGETVLGGVTAGMRYAKVHIGPRGKVWTIRPKPGRKYLTIPLSAARTGAGVARGSARSGVFGDTFVRMSRAGNLIIFGRQTYTRGARAGESKGKIVPLFLLKKSVRVPTRVAFEDVVPPVGQDLMRLMKKELLKNA